jgi:hypothetical protein
MTESMMGQFVRFMRFCNRRWVKWPTVIVFLTAITVAHFVMADKYGDLGVYNYAARRHAGCCGNYYSILQETYQT